MPKVLLFFVALFIISCGNSMEETLKAPVAEKIPVKLEKFGLERIDNYFWMNERDAPKVLEYLNAENDYTENVMAPFSELREKLFEEISGRIKETDMSVPYFKKGYWYYTRFEEKKEYPIYCRKQGTLEAPEQIMIDGNKLAEGTSYFNIAALSVSPDNNLLAYSKDTTGRRQYDIYILDLQTGELIEEGPKNISGGIAWASDSKTYFYTLKDTVTLRAYQINRKELGKDEITTVFEEKDETFSCTVYRSKSEQYIFIASGSTISSEYRYLEADKPNAEFKIVSPRQRDHEYSVNSYGDSFYIVSNFKAQNFRLLKAKPGVQNPEKWEEIIAHRDDVLLEDIEIFKNFLVLAERKEGLNQIRVINWLSKEEYYLDFEDPAYVASAIQNMDFDTDLLRYSYSSLTTPQTTLEFNMVTKEKNILKQQEVGGNFEQSLYESQRFYATASDGVKVPISIVYRKDMPPSAESPVLLYGYGSYGYSMDAYFSSARLSLLDRGFVFAIAHIRGGEEMGRQWYFDGKLLKKKNTFTDFIACSEHLVQNGFASKEKVFAMGGSAGGLLIGAVINMRPDLFKGVIAGVPFVDVVTTMLDDSIPLTTGEYDEWGNPNEEEYFRYMLSYSPYDNVVAQNYPNILITTGYHDSQVQYWEPAKWTAKLRELKTDNNLLLFKTNMSAGHSGSSGRFSRNKEIALEYTFLLMLNEKK